jgi:hypothetical protein
MTQEPRQEVEVQGAVGRPVALPLGTGTDPAYPWTLELPEGVEQADEGSGGPLQVSAGRPGSYVVVATLCEPSGAPMTVLPIRLTVA